MKRKWVVSASVWLLAVLVLLTGCAPGGTGRKIVRTIETDEAPWEEAEFEGSFQIYDRENQPLASVPIASFLWPVEGGFVYSVMLKDQTNRFLLYDYASRKSMKLGDVPDIRYVASHEACYRDEHLYLLDSVGDSPTSFGTPGLLALDLEQGTLKQITFPDSLLPYSTMTLFEDKLLIVVTDAGESRIVSCDPDTMECETLLTYHFDVQTEVGEVIRQITSDQEKVYLLRLVMPDGATSRLYVDTFDRKMKLLGSEEITAHIAAGKSERDADLAVRRIVTHFEVRDGSVYYENDSLERALFRLDGKGQTEVDIDMQEAASVADKRTPPLFYRSDGTLYIWQKGAMERVVGRHQDSGQPVVRPWNLQGKQPARIASVVQGRENRIMVVLYGENGVVDWGYDISLDDL